MQVHRDSVRTVNPQRIVKHPIFGVILVASAQLVARVPDVRQQGQMLNVISFTAQRQKPLREVPIRVKSREKQIQTSHALLARLKEANVRREIKGVAEIR